MCLMALWNVKRLVYYKFVNKIKCAGQVKFLEGHACMYIAPYELLSSLYYTE